MIGQRPGDTVKKYHIWNKHVIVTSYIHTSLHTYIMNIIKGHRDYS